MTSSQTNHTAPGDWDAFLEATMARPPRDTLLRAMEAFGAPGHAAARAADLGAGAGNETLALLHAGWCVDAFDTHAPALDLIQRRALDAGRGDQLTTHPQSIHDARPGRAMYNLVHAGFAWPFVPPEQFNPAWHRWRGAVRPGGVFSGELFGVRDSWNDPGGMPLTFHTDEQVALLLDGLDLLHFEAVERDGTTALGTSKHWHVFHFVGRVPS